MPLLKKHMKWIPFAALLLTAACSDGWQVVYTKDVRPYGNERTAGSGVVYVREVLMPAKTLSLKPIASVEEESMGEVIDTENVQETSESHVQKAIEKFFTKKQAK